MIAVVTPTTTPNWLNSGPPLDPGEIGAEMYITVSSWLHFFAAMSATPHSGWTCESRPLVTVLSNPSGLPIATTLSPADIALLSPSWSVGRSLPGRGWIWSSARSRAGSRPSTWVTGYSEPSGSLILIADPPTTTGRLAAT